VIINGRKIGPGEPPYMIAEISGNHQGSFEKAAYLMGLAAGAGADAVKIQCYTADSLTIDSDGSDFIIKEGPWKGRKLHELYRKAQTPPGLVESIFHLAKQYGQTVFSSVFDKTGLELLESLECPAYKIASMEIVDIPLIKAVARTGKPLIISTGMASEEEIDAAMVAAGNNATALACISGYPTPVAEADLRKIGRSHFVTGISDHTVGVEIPIAATALGASIIEKHFCVSREDDIEDAEFSMEPEEFKGMCKTVRDTWTAINTPRAPTSQESSKQFRRSLYVVENMEAGEIFTNENVRSIRPAYGLPPKELPKILGKHTIRRLKRGQALTWEMISA